MRAVRSLRGCAAAREDKAITAEAWARETPDKMVKHWRLINGLSQIIAGKLARVEELVDEDLVCIWSVIIAALSESERTVSGAIYDVHNSFPVEVSSDALGRSAVSFSNQA